MIVTGLSEAERQALSKASAAWTNDEWSSLLKVTTGGANAPPIAGRYSVSATVEFHPLYAFDPGREYTVRLDPARLPIARADSILVTRLSMPAAAPTTPTTVARILPTAGTIPENALRFYVEFSAPMSRQPGVDFVHLLDDTGREVTHAFLPLDADFWNRDHTRYTIFLDPGRVKRGILPNEQMGRALRAGHKYALVVDSAWRDANGLPLAKSYRQEFFASPAALFAIAPKAWRIQPPGAGTRNPLIVGFPRSLDHGLLQRALGVETRTGASIRGDIQIGEGETTWSFTPREPWRAGDYTLVVLSILEDVAGNRVGRAFEVDMWDRVDSTTAPERTALPFIVK